MHETKKKKRLNYVSSIPLLFHYMVIFRLFLPQGTFALVNIVQNNIFPTSIFIMIYSRKIRHIPAKSKLLHNPDHHSSW